LTGLPFPEQLRMHMQAEALRHAFPGWAIAVQAWSGNRLRIEAVNRGDGGLYALVSSDPREIWAELRAL
jgi:hypothetical protein